MSPFHEGRKADGRHYWLTPKPDGYDGLTAEWGRSNYVNPPFGSIMHEGKKKGPTAWARKAIAEQAKGKDVVLVFPLDKWIHYLLNAGAELRSLGDVKWCSTEDGSPAPAGIGRYTMAFILRGKRQSAPAAQEGEKC